ncbi:MAG: DUF1552 domain-containing protein [Planctomycetaceae bacterium]
MNRFQRLPRRTFLKGLGCTMALPMLEAMRPALTVAAPSVPVQAAPTRMAFIFFPNGAIMDAWRVKGEGTDFELSRTLEPLNNVKSEINVITGLAQHHANANGDGAGDHARNASAFLTGCQPRKTAGADIHVGISADQAAAEEIGSFTRLPSLELGIDRSRNAGSCDSGYSCAYSSNISWKTPSQPTAKEINPRLAFERLFGTGEEHQNRAQRNLYRQSILDLVAQDAAELKQQLGRPDRRKLDEYFTSVRELEVRIERTATKKVEVPEYDVPEGIPKELVDHVRIMYDIMLLAFQTDTTRIATFMLGNAGSNRSYPEVEVNDGHHELSHHRDDEDKIEKIARIDRYLVKQYAYFIERLRSIKEGDGTLLDNCMVLYGSAISDGNRHEHDDLPLILAGRGGRTIQTGRHLVYKDETPLNNLFVSMCRRAGATGVQSLGDSEGVLKRLDG